ncbi:hypothetical protein H5410_052339 [Solanum commersonii]|uniref:Uncharacterized protein n=1 Tax=Solanum commersonii TaxID=4109 RepID=A0A9J5X3S9_SOLCO|nr:hypothetical protein H5410_052339 [Solanum commersonii]
MYGIWQKLKDVKRSLKIWISTIRHLGQARDIIEMEKTVKANLEKWINIEESIVKQKSKGSMATTGGWNTTYFHASLKNRLLVSCATQMHVVSQMIMKDGPILNRIQQAQLIAHLSR